MATLFGHDNELTLTAAQWATLDRAIVGDGGAQALLRQILACHTGQRRLLIDDRLLDRAYVYAYRYSSPGGFQQRFRLVVQAALHAGWSPARDAGESQGTARPFGKRAGHGPGNASGNEAGNADGNKAGNS